MPSEIRAVVLHRIVRRFVCSAAPVHTPVGRVAGTCYTCSEPAAAVAVRRRERMGKAARYPP